MGALLTREAILAASDLKFEEVAVPEWGGTVRVATMSGWARDSFEQAMASARDESKFVPNVRARIVSLAVVDEKGELIFSESDIEALGKKSVVALERVYNAASALNALRAEDVEALEKNSGAAPSGASTSNLPSV